MALVIISNLAPIKDKEISFFCSLVDEFRSEGYDCILWSCAYHPKFADFYLPMNWRIMEWSKYYKPRNIDIKTAYALVDRNKWKIRVDQLCKQDYDKPSRTELLDIIVKTSFDILNTFKPDLFLSWNTLCPHAGIAHEMCGNMGIPSILIERAMFPNTWFIEDGGLLGNSRLSGIKLSEIVSNSERNCYEEIGRNYLKETSFGSFDNYAQKQHSEKFETLQKEPFALQRPKIVFFPPDDGTLGFKPVNGTDRIATLPYYESSFDAAKQLSLANEGITIFKPHPSFLEQTFDTTGYPNLFVIDYDYRKLIEWSDIVASTGSGLEFVAIANNKPVLLMANDILKGKEIAYEAQNPEMLSCAIENAFKKIDFVERQRHFYEFIGYLLTKYLISCNHENTNYRQTGDVVQELCQKYLSHTDNTLNLEMVNKKKVLLLKSDMVEKLIHDYREINQVILMEKTVSEVPMLMDEYIRNNNITNPDAIKYVKEHHKDRFIKSFEWVYPLVNRNTNIKILEIGAPGFFTFLLKKFFPTTYIENISSDLRYPFQLKSEQYDLILKMEVIEHIKDQNEARLAVVDFSGVNNSLSECYRVLKKDGLMVLTTPNVNSYRNIYRMLKQEPPWLFRGHFQEYSIKEISDFLEASNFEIEKQETINVWNKDGVDTTEKIIKSENFSVEDREDCIFIIARKKEINIQPQQSEENDSQKNKERLFKALERNKNSCAVLDFDYTLFLRNSTDTYLDKIRPKWYGYLLVKVSDKIVSWMSRKNKLSFFQWRDFFRAFTTCFFAPWTYLFWQLSAKKRVQQNLNKELLDKVMASSPSRVIIISFGYKHLIAPLLSKMPVQAELICSKVMPNLLNLRSFGKREAIKSLLSQEEINNSVFVTDSKEDKELLELFPNSHLLTWTKIQPPPFQNVYFPFRYTAEGKYPGKNIIWNQQFGEDLIVLLLAYELTGPMFPAIILFFVSFFCIYEIGYYENDFKAANKESKPFLSGKFKEFSSYPINRFGWFWAIFLGFTGSFFVTSSGYSFILFAKWVGILILVRFVFWVFNKLRVSWRIYFFPILQLLKTFSYVAVFTLTYAGALLLFSQVMRQVTNYIIYRNGGNVVQFKRQAHRLLIFVLLVTALSITFGFNGEHIFDWRFGLIVGWIVYRVLRERHGFGVRPFKGLLKDMKGVCFFVLSNIKKQFYSKLNKIKADEKRD